MKLSLVRAWFATTVITAILSCTMLQPSTARAGLWDELPSDAMTVDPIEKLFEWTPTGTGDNPLSAECRRANLESLIEQGGSARTINQRLNKWLKKCESQINRDNAGKFGVLLDLTNITHPANRNPLLKKVTFHLSDGRKINALMALKPNDGRKRPLVIAKCGLYCDANLGSTAKSFFMHLFEESPFHVVILANSTGPEFSRANQSVALGGFDEGYQILDVAKALTADDSGIADRISTLHVIGFSLGSQGVLFSSIYDSFPQNGFPKISSVMAVCPVVDLGPTIKQGFSDSPRGLYYRILTLQNLREIFEFVPILGDILNMDKKLSRPELYRGLSEGAVRYYKEMTKTRSWGYAPLQDLRISTADDLWNANRVQNYLDLIQVPTLLVHSYDDYFVESRLNSLVIEDSLRKTPRENIGVIGFQRGNHCAISAANGWDTITTLFRSYIIAHSPSAKEFLNETRVNIRSVVKNWGWPMNYSLWKGERVVRAGWRLSEGKDKVKLMFRIYTPYGNGMGGGGDSGNYCYTHQDNPGSAPDNCIRTIIGKVPISYFRSVGLRTPISDFEAETMTRWLNTNSDFLADTGAALYGTERMPGDVTIRGNYQF